MMNGTNISLQYMFSVVSKKYVEGYPVTMTQTAMNRSPKTLEKLVNISAKIMSEKKTGARKLGINILFNILSYHQ